MTTWVIWSHMLYWFTIIKNWHRLQLCENTGKNWAPNPTLWHNTLAAEYRRCGKELSWAKNSFSWKNRSNPHIYIWVCSKMLCTFKKYMPKHQLPNLLHFIQYHLLLVIDNEVAVVHYHSAGTSVEKKNKSSIFIIIVIFCIYFLCFKKNLTAAEPNDMMLKVDFWGQA